jgi:hypothetical protein
MAGRNHTEVMTHAETKSFWMSQDWTLTDAEIARITGRKQNTVASARRSYKRPKPANPAPDLRKTDKFREAARTRATKCSITPDEFLYNKDTVIAKAHGVSRQRVQQLRYKLGLVSSALIK